MTVAASRADSVLWPLQKPFWEGSNRSWESKNTTNSWFKYFSIILAGRGRRGIGRRLLTSSGSPVGFFLRGITMASFQDWGRFLLKGYDCKHFQGNRQYDQKLTAKCGEEKFHPENRNSTEEETAWLGYMNIVAVGELLMSSSSISTGGQSSSRLKTSNSLQNFVPKIGSHVVTEILGTYGGLLGRGVERFLITLKSFWWVSAANRIFVVK